jgi:hypothetical protein
MMSATRFLLSHETKLLRGRANATCAIAKSENDRLWHDCIGRAGGRSASALPGYLRHRFFLRSHSRRRPRRQDSGKCSRPAWMGCTLRWCRPWSGSLVEKPPRLRSDSSKPWILCQLADHFDDAWLDASLMSPLGCQSRRYHTRTRAPSALLFAVVDPVAVRADSLNARSAVQ